VSILRYNPNPLWWWLAFQTHDKGKFCEYRDYVKLEAENARLRAEVDAWKDMVADSGVACNERARENQDLKNQIERLKAEVERLKEGNEYLDQMHEKEMARSAFLCEQVERLTKAVMHSPAAQLKLKELEGKTTFDEINPKEGKQP
jgi:cell division protein FtsB